MPERETRFEESIQLGGAAHPADAVGFGPAEDFFRFGQLRLCDDVAGAGVAQRYYRRAFAIAGLQMRRTEKRQARYAGLSSRRSRVADNLRRCALPGSSRA